MLKQQLFSKRIMWKQTWKLNISVWEDRIDCESKIYTLKSVK